MKKIFFLSAISFSFLSFAQSKPKPKSNEYVSFIIIVNIKNATKDGIYMKDYVVNLSYDQIKKLDGKRVKVFGKVSIEKGLENDNSPLIRQGREKDTKHLLNPKITILKS